MRTVHLGVALIVLSAAPALASSDSDAFDRAGILGTWAEDCSKPPSADNYHLIYRAASDGSVSEVQRTTGDDARKIRNVQILSDDWLAYSYFNSKDDNKYSIVTRKQGNRKKSWWSARHDGTALIMNGKFTGSGQDVPWFEKCK